MSEPRATIGYGYRLPDNVSYLDAEDACNGSEQKCSVIYSGSWDYKTDFAIVVDESIQNFGWESVERVGGHINQPNPRPNSVKRLREICEKLNIPFNQYECDWFCATYINN